MEAIDEQKYIAKTASFEGPLDLLLQLIENRKLFINEVSLSEVTSDYTEYVTRLREQKIISHYEITGYLVVLATLLLIKSRSLLPNFEMTVEETTSVENLEERLNLYKIYREISKEIEKRFGNKILYTKNPEKTERVVFSPDIHITKDTLHDLMKEIISRVESDEVENLPEVEVKQSITLEDVIKKISDKVEEMTSFSFRNFTGNNGEQTKEQKVFAVISFLAILELIRTGILDADQGEIFGDMYITKQHKIYE